MTASWGASVFDKLYAEREDPWDFQNSEYETQKYARSLVALGKAHFAHGLEIGCSIGVLTRLLAARCGNLLAVDGSEAALARARQRCEDLPQVRFARAMVPQDWPHGVFDMMVFSEILYFLDADDIRTVAARATGALNEGGTILLVNWTGATDTPNTGAGAAELFVAASGLQPVVCEKADRYRIDVLRGERLRARRNMPSRAM